MTFTRRSAFLAGSLALFAAPTTARAQPALIPLRVGGDTGWEYSEAFYARDVGFFTKAGLNVEITALSSGAAISAAVAAGQLDLGVSSLVPLSIAYARGLPFVIVAGGALETLNVPGGVLCVAKDGPIRSAADLAGKPIAVNALKNLAEMMLDAWLAQHGVDLAQVRVVELRYTEMALAIERGTIAAAVISEPALSPAMRSNTLRVLGDVYATVGAEYVISCWFSTRPFVQANADAVRRFQTAIYEAGRWANTHPDDAIALNAKYAQMDPEVLKKMVRRVYATQLRVADVQPVLDVAAKYNVTPRPVGAADLILR
jgi:NitT/TauT family transport system substrate-binding protein